MENYALLAFRHAPTPIVVLSYRRIKALNDAFAHLFGYAHDELLNQSMQKLFPSVEDFEKIGKEALTGLGLQTNMYYCDERFMRHKTGEIFWATTHGRTLTPDDPFKLAIWHFEKNRKYCPNPSSLHVKPKLRSMWSMAIPVKRLVSYLVYLPEPLKCIKPT